ncbi:hypothetical protein [Psychromonas ossibalaenae]|uniref:hypothetical protein n=1 Tax=Psychromonas ossibalaenae TaxID=444922 RepID=UPI00037E5170|nr:hypothetical protein [Psychromonas ossibalaenae]
MKNGTKYQQLHNNTRVAIALLSFVGLLVEGPLSDFLVMLAIILWLWQPELSRYFLHAVKKYKQTVRHQTVHF